MGAPGPTIRSSDDPDLARRLEELEAQNSKLYAEKRKLEQHVAKAEYVRSYSPPPGPLSLPPIPVDGPPPSLRPGREWIGVVIRRTDPKWLGLALVLGILAWALGGPEGIAEKWAIAWGARANEAKLAELERRLQKREEHDVAFDRHAVATREEQVSFRAQLRQLFERQGVEWDPPEGAPPERALRVTVPLRPRGTVSKGPSLIVDSPMTLPPAVPSSTP